jgi:hypothetical protein
MTTGIFVDRALVSMDQARHLWLRLCLRQPALARLLAHRARRTAALATLGVGAALVLAMVVPLVPLLLGPVVLGVAHVGADVRYLVLRRRLSVSWRRVVVLGCAVLLASRALSEIGAWRTSARTELALVVVWIATALLMAVREGGDARRGRGVLLALLALGAPALAWPDTARLVFLHAHNLVALLIWGALFRRRVRVPLLPLALLAGGAVLLGSGVLAGPVLRGPGAQLFGLHLLQACDWLAPQLDVRFAVGLTTCFAFLQSAHYLTWLFLIPQEEVAAAGTPTFRMSARSLHRDLGATGIVVLMSATVLVLVAAAFALLRTRAVYLSLAAFHGYLELAMAAYLYVSGGAPAAARSAPRSA